MFRENFSPPLKSSSGDVKYIDRSGQFDGDEESLRRDQQLILYFHFTRDMN